MTPKRMQNRTIFAALAGLLLVVSSSLAQRIPASIKQSSRVTYPDQAITDFVQAQVKNLASDNPSTQKAGRQALMDQVAGSGWSAAFLDVYATTVNEALMPLASDKNLRVRLNAAIANGEIARRVSNHRQAKVTLAFMNDKTDPVALWGLKAAKYELPALLTLPVQIRTVNLLPAVVETVKAHSESGPCVEEAYQALTLETMNNFALIPQGMVPAFVKAVTPELLKLFEYRISLYATGAPVSPTADNAATIFLTRTQVWPLQTAVTQQLIMKDMDALLEVLALQISNPNAQNKTELVDLFKQTGKAFQVLADHQSDPVLQKAAAGIASITPETSPDDLQKVLADLKSAISTKEPPSATGSTPAGSGSSATVTPAIETSTRNER